MNLPHLRGPSLGTKLMLLGAALLIVPWFSFRQLVEMESFLIQGQSQAQLLTAEGISTLLNGREDLFNDLPISLEGYEALYAHPLRTPIRLDARDGDWGDTVEERKTFGAAARDNTTDAAPQGVPERDGAFDLILGERSGQLHGFMRVRDDRLVWRDPDYLRLDNADHVRLSYVTAEGQEGRLQITLESAGVISAYRMDSDWVFAQNGQPENRVQGFVEQTDTGYTLEFRLPLTMIGSRRSFGVAVADVDDPEQRTVQSITQTLPQAGRESFNLVVLRSPEVLNIIQGLGYSGARILVIDPQKRVRAETGSYQSGAAEEVAEQTDWSDQLFELFRPVVRTLLSRASTTPEERSPAAGPLVADRVISTSLEGEPSALRRRLPNDEEIIMAAYPIISRDTIIGSVVVEQNTDDILNLQRVALEQIIVVSGGSLLAVFIALLAFAVRLAWRIRGLGAETTNSIDQHGRLMTSSLRREINSGDEIGDLARSVSNMLSKLHQHNRFLENMPRTLRHEINNPLNTLSTSLQHLEAEIPELANSKYLESAKRGVNRIGSIVQNLADAASLEESLESEELEVVDLDELLGNYISNCTHAHPDCRFTFTGPEHPVLALVSDYRIEQLMDKIIDNAVDFHWPGSYIRVQLQVQRHAAEITVANRGPKLPEDVQATLFDSMVSQRSGTRDNRLHFGLGLYVVRIIAERHGGSVKALNLADGSGVAITVTLPLTEAQPRLRTSTGASASASA